MASVFHSFDCRNNPEPQFWQKIDPRVNENLLSGSIFGRDLHIRRPNGSFKVRKCILTKSHLYCLSKWNIPKLKVHVSWKSVEPFTECVQQCTYYGFRLSGCHSQDFYLKNSKELDLWIEHLAKVSIVTTFDEDLIILKQIGTGTGTIVNLCQCAESQKEYALKSVSKSILAEKPEKLQLIFNEISTLRSVTHENIVELYKVYETNTHVHLLLEYLPHGDLSKLVKKNKKVPQAKVLIIMQKILQALEYLHSMNIVHRDIKLENIVIFNEKEIDVKIVDFGLACDSRFNLFQRCGSPGCVAPEILRGNGYNTKVDLFSVGVLMYNLLFGKSPFEAKDGIELIEKNKKCDIAYGNFRFNGISQNTMNLLNALLSPNPSVRISAKEALETDCIKNIDDCKNVQSTSGRNSDCVNDVYKGKQYTFDYKHERLNFKARKIVSMEGNSMF